MAFCTAINCMDGRVQLPVIRYLQKRFNVEYVDSITEPGPNLILAEGKNDSLVQSIHERLKISLGKHKSVGIAIVGHYHCAGNPAPDEEQLVQLEKCVQHLRSHYEAVPIIGLWVDATWAVHEVIQDKR